VGHTTLIDGSGPLIQGHGPVRTGVTAVLPAEGDPFLDRVFCASYVLNGAGEATGLGQINEWGICETPILLTNTLSIGGVADATVSWLWRNHPRIGQDVDVVIPCVAECDDSYLNDAAGRHVTPEHVWSALDTAKSGPVAEGCVGAGTGMMTFEFAGGIGTSSRELELAGETHRVGALVLSNFGDREQLRMDGVPVGRILAQRYADRPRRGAAGSIIVLLATDVPSSARQLQRFAARAALAIGRTGGYAANNSGEIVIAWSTANRIPRSSTRGRHTIELVLDTSLDPFYEATVDVVEEAILNALCAGVDMTGQSGRVAPALPLDAVREALERYRPLP
jgi:D-aminopeptidase